ncbi:unnamed protein product [Discosporangium mesarthrocarpum]
MRSHPRAVAEHRELVLACLSDDDVTIRTRALELLSGAGGGNNAYMPNWILF